jgi:CRP-like cAMP-binding protein
MDAKEKMVEFIQRMQPMTIDKALAITDFFGEKNFKKNDLLIQSKKICNEYYFLTDGFVRSYLYNAAGEDITTGFSTPGQIVCELFSFFKRVPAKEDFQALSDCATLYIGFDDLQFAFHTLPEFREFGRSILVNEYARLKNNMLSSLQETAESRYKQLIETSPAIFQHAPLKNIASYLGVTDTSLSRIRKEFSKK